MRIFGWPRKRRQPTIEELRERCPDVVVAMLCERYEFSLPWPEDPDEVPCWRLRDDEWSRATGIPVPCPARTLREFLIQTLPHEVDALRQLRVYASQRLASARIESAGTVMVPISVEPSVEPMEPQVEPPVEPQENRETSIGSTVPPESVEPTLEPSMEPVEPTVEPQMEPLVEPVEPQQVQAPFMPALVVSNSTTERMEKALEWISNYHDERGVWPSLHVVQSSLELPKSTAYRYRSMAMSKEAQAA